MLQAARITILIAAAIAFLLIALLISARADGGDEPPPMQRWRPWQQTWQCNDIRMTITSREERLIEYDLSGSIWGGSSFAVDFRRDLEGTYYFNGRPCGRLQ